MHAFRRLSLFVFFALITALAGNASAATSELRVLFDVDNNVATGCSVPGMSGVEQVLVTTIETTETSARVSSTHRLVCSGSTLGAPTDVTGGWPAGFQASSGAMTVETRIAYSALAGSGMPTGMRVGFVGQSGTVTDSVLSLTTGQPILFPTAPQGRRRAVNPDPNDRNIVLDGQTSDWGMVAPLTTGTGGTGKKAIRLQQLYAYGDGESFFFRFESNVSAKSAPTAADDVFSVRQAQILTVAAPGILANDTDADGAPLTAVLVTSPTQGVLSLSANGGFSYTHNGGPSISDFFEYRASNGSLDSNIARVTINISPNGAPTALADSYNVAHRGTVNVPAPGVLANDSDPDGDPLAAIGLTQPVNGSVVFNTNGALTYTHNGTNTTSDSFTYSASDGISQSGPTQVTLNIAADIAPTAVADAYTVAEGGTLNVAAPGLFANDSDPDTPQSLWSVQIVTPPVNGTLTLGAGGAFSYVHNGGETTTDSFVYRVNDGIVNSANATVSITITPVNDAPVVVSSAQTTNEDTVLNIAAPGVLTGATDAEGTALTATLVASAANGNVVLNPNGSYSYTPNANFNGTDTFTFTATDGAATSNVGTVTITVTAVNDAPVFAAGAGVTVLEDSGAYNAAWATGVSPGPADEGAQTLTFTVTNTNNALFTVQPSISPAGVLTFTPAANANGAATVSVTLADNGSGTAPNVNTSATVNFTLTVTAVNDVPSFTKGGDLTVLDTAGAQTVNPWATALSAGPANEIQNLSFTIQNVSDPAIFSVLPVVSAAGVLTFTPAAGTDGVATVTLVIRDDGGTANGGVDTSASQTFTINVHRMPAITSANTATFVVGTNGSFSVTTTGRPRPSIARGGVALPAGVTFVDNGDGTGTLSGTPAPGTAGVYNITFTATNVHGSSPVQNFTLNIHEAPAITSANNVTFDVGAPGTFTVTTTGFPAAAIARGGVALPSGVTFTDNGNGTGTLAGTPAAATGGTYAITFTATNVVGSSPVQNFTLTVRQPAAITSGNATTFTAGQAGTFSVTVTGFPTPSIAAGGAALPSGVTFTDNGNGTGTLAGTPAPGTGGTYNITFTATNSLGSTAPQAFTLTVHEVPAVTSANNTAFVVGQAGTFTVTTTGFPVASIARGGVVLPAGITFTDNGNGTGTLAGTPAAATGGTYAITFTATNVAGSSPVQSFTLTVNQPPAITSTNTTTFIVGQAGTFTITTTGFPAPEISRGGVALPSGVTFTDNGNGTATLAGTPGAGTAGNYAISFQATNGFGADATQPFTLVVHEVPAITSANNVTFTTGQAGTFTVTTTGTPVPSIARGGVALPSGVTFTDNGNGTGTLAGTPAAATGGTYAITFTATNAAGSSPTQSFTLTVNQAPAVTSANNTTFLVGQAGTFTITTSGFPAASIARTGDALPAGVTFTDNGNGTGTLAGTPNAGTGGTYNLIFTPTNAAGTGAAQAFTLTVNQIPTITSANNVTFTTGQLGTFTVTTTGVPTPSIARGGDALPAGVTFTDNGNGTGTLTGTPGATTGGVYNITFTATNVAGSSAVQSFTLTVNQAPAVTSANNTTFTVGQAGTFTITTSGFPAPSIARGGDALPSGITFVDNGNGTGTLAGTPGAGTGGTYNLTFTPTNVAGTGAAQPFTLTVNQIPAITSANNVTFTTGQLGTFTVTTTGVPTPSIARGGDALPAGVTFTDNGNGTGTLTGTPGATTGGIYNITFTATNVAGSSAAQSFTLTVNQAPAVTSANNATFTVGQAGTFTITTSGFPAPSIARGGDALPAGVTFTDNGNGTGTLAGTPDPGTGGTYNLTFTPTNVAGTGVAQAFTLTIQQIPTITSANSVTFTTGQLGTFTVTTTGVPTPSIARGGVALPAGVTFTDNGNGTGTLTGTPNAATGGTYSITFTATNVAGSSPAQTFTLTVNETPQVTSGNAKTFLIGTNDTFTVTTNGFPAASIAIGGAALPAGITFVDNGNGTGTLGGTADPGTGGTYNITFTPTNVAGTGTTQNFTLTVQQVPAVTSANSATFTVGQNGTFTVTTSGFPTPSIARGGVALPSGVTFTDNGNGTGTLTGTPAATTGGSYSITFTATNAAGSSPAQTFTLTVNETPQITSGNAKTFLIGTNDTFTVTTNGFPAASIAIGGAALPAGITFVDNGNGTGTLGGTAQAGTGGTYNITFTPTNAAGSGTTQNFTVTVQQAPTITSGNSITFTTGAAGTFLVTTTGFPTPSITRGGAALPTGVTFTDNGDGTGTLAGTPANNTGGTYAITFTATNAAGTAGPQAFTLTVNEAPEITSANNTTFTVGQTGTFTVTTQGFPTSALTQGGVALPSGVTFTDNGNGTGTLAGTPDPGTNNTYNITFTAANGVAPDAVQNFTFTVLCPPVTVAPAAGALPDATFGVAYNQSFTASGIAGAFTYSVTAGALPGGLTLDGSTGALTGSPTATGNFSFTIRGTHNATTCFGETAYTLIVRPNAQPDNYGTTAGTEAVGNTQVVVDGHSAPTTPFVAYSGSIIANDSPAGVTVTAGTFATTGAGSITVDAAGKFIYTPAVGFTGDDTFVYTITSNSVTNTATITIRVADMLWYVDSGAAAGNGQSQSPFNTLNAAQAPSAAGSTIYVHSGTPTGALAMDATQTLHGKGSAFTLRGLSLAAGIAPTLPGGVTISSNSTVRGVTIANAAGTSLAGSGAIGTLTVDNVTINGTVGVGFSALTAGTGTFTNSTISTSTAGGSAVSVTNSAFTSVTFTNTPISATTGAPVVLTGNTAGQLTFNSALTLAPGAAAAGINISSNSGTFGVTFNGAVTVTPPAGSTRGITIANNTASNDTLFANTVLVNATSVEAMRISGNSGAHAVSFTGASKTFNASSSNAVVITANFNGTAGSVAFSGGNTDITTTTAGTALSIDKGAATNSGVVTIAGAGNDISAAGTALNVSDLATGAGFTFNSTTSAGGTSNVVIANPNGAAFALGTGNLTGATTTGVGGGAVLISGGGTMTLTSSNSITANANVRPVNIAGLAGDGTTTGLITFSGLVTGVSGSHGIQVANNTSGRVNFNGNVTLPTTGNPAVTLATNGTTLVHFGAQLDIDTTTGAGIVGTVSGQLQVSGSASNTIDTTTGTPLSLDTYTIGASGLTFRSINANGAANGIVLRNTGTNGLTVTGNSAGNCGGLADSNTGDTRVWTTVAANSADCTGGTLQNITGADGATAGNAIYLENAQKISLTRMRILSATNHAIKMTTVTRFTGNNLFITGTVGNNAAFDEGGIWISNLTGSGVDASSITNSTIEGVFEYGVFMVNSAGTLDRLTFDNVTFGLNNTTSGDDGLSIEASAGTTNVTIDNCRVLGARGDLINFNYIGTAAGNVITDNTEMHNAHTNSAGGGYTLNTSESADVTYTISGNSLRKAVGPAMIVQKLFGASPGNGTMSGTITNNTIGESGVASSGSSAGSGLLLGLLGRGNHTSLITNNVIRQYRNYGLYLFVGGSGANTTGLAAHDGTYHVTVQNNTIAEPDNLSGLPQYGIHLNGGTNSGPPTDSYSMCVNILSNTIDAGGGTAGGSVGEDLVIRQRFGTTLRLPGYGGANNDNAAAATFVRNQNNNSASISTLFSNTVATGGGGFTGGAACTQP